MPISAASVYREDTNQFFYYPQKGPLRRVPDRQERPLARDQGEDRHGSESEVDDRIIDLQTGGERDLLDRNGAGGHSDIGFGYMVASDNYNSQPGAVRLWDFNLDMTAASRRVRRGTGHARLPDDIWDTDVGHVASATRKPASRSASSTSCSAMPAARPAARERNLCFRLDGSLKRSSSRPISPTSNAAGGGSDDYWKLPKGNLDVTGEYFIWTANAGTSRSMRTSCASRRAG